VILLTGFGPFLDVEYNPSAALVSACHGLRIGGETIIGRVLPVSYRRAIPETVKLAEALKPRLILGTGLSRRARSARLESYAYSDYSQRLCDVDGETGRCPLGPKQVAATLDTRRLSDCLEVERSTDPGRYVCNAWLYEVSLALPETEVGFLHLATEGFELPRLLGGLRAYFQRERSG
jgi:pyroglutamyl-peptidase